MHYENEDPAPLVGEPQEPMQLLAMAIQRGVPVESLERIQAMCERAADRHATQEYASALAAFQSECPPLKASRVGRVTTKSGGSYSYNYANLQDIVEAIRMPLARNGLSYSWDSAFDGKTLSVTCTVRHANGHATQANVSLPVDNPSAMNDQQKVGSAMSYGRRFSLTAALGLATGDIDDDAQSASRDPTAALPVSQIQIAALREEIEDRAVDVEAFCRFMGVEQLRDIPQGDFNRALEALRKKKKPQDGAGT